MPFKPAQQLQEQREQWVGCKERMIFLLHVGWENRPSMAASLPDREKGIVSDGNLKGESCLPLCVVMG